MTRPNGPRQSLPHTVVAPAIWLVVLLCFSGRESVFGETAPNFRWAHKIEWPAMLYGYGLDVDNQGNTYFTGVADRPFGFGSVQFAEIGMVLV
jgi:hypothetical protein